MLFVDRVSYDKPYRDVWPDLQSRARTILQIDNTHWGARYFLALARIIHDCDWERGRRELESVLRETQEDPGSSVWVWKSVPLCRFAGSRLR